MNSKILQGQITYEKISVNNNLKYFKPSISKKQNLLPTIPGEIPDLINLSGGCIFKNRCDQSIERCDKVTPILNKFDTHHFVSCHLIES